MYRLWDAIVEPLLEAVRPKSVVEIGSERGPNTRNLLDFCERTGATLHAVDPAPGSTSPSCGSATASASSSTKP